MKYLFYVFNKNPFQIMIIFIYYNNLRKLKHSQQWTQPFMEGSNIGVDSRFRTTWYRRSPRCQSNCGPFTVMLYDQCSTTLASSFIDIIRWLHIIENSKTLYKLVPISVTSVKTISSSTYHHLREKLFPIRFVVCVFTCSLVLKLNTSKIQIFISIISIVSEARNKSILIFQLFFEPLMGLISIIKMELFYFHVPSIS